jgi:outer membrane protein assembly factor BamB
MYNLGCKPKPLAGVDNTLENVYVCDNHSRLTLMKCKGLSTGTAEFWRWLVPFTISKGGRLAMGYMKEIEEYEETEWQTGTTSESPYEKPPAGIRKIWRMFRRNKRHTARSLFTGPQKPRLKWVFPTADAVLSRPAIDTDGTIYVGSYDGKLYAVNPDGTMKWSFLTREGVGDSSPAIGGDGTIYVGSWDGKLYCVRS